MSKKTGLIVGIIGIVLYIFTIPAVKTALKISLPAPITDTYLIVGAIILVLLGAYLFTRTGNLQASEVPIYEKGRVVGYRRA